MYVWMFQCNLQVSPSIISSRTWLFCRSKCVKGTGELRSTIAKKPWEEKTTSPSACAPRLYTHKHRYVRNKLEPLMQYILKQHKYFVRKLKHEYPSSPVNCTIRFIKYTLSLVERKKSLERALATVFNTFRNGVSVT